MANGTLPDRAKPLHLVGGLLIGNVSTSHMARPAVATPNSPRNADVFIADGVIVGIGTPPPHFDTQNARVVDVAKAVVAPGLVDLSARLHQPWCAPDATMAAEMRAAVAGGVTSLICPPDMDPPLDSAMALEMFGAAARRLGDVRVFPLGALTAGLRGEASGEFAAMSAAGCLAFTQADAPLPNARILLRALEYAATFDHAVWLRPQEVSLAAGGVLAGGPLATRLGLQGVPDAAEVIAIHTIVDLMRLSGARVHLSHLSSARGVALVRSAKAEGLPITCDVTIHHVHLVDVDIGWFDARYRFDPPLRGTRDRDAIRAGLLDGTIDAICSAHIPWPSAAKQQPFALAPAGASGLETLLSLTIKWALEADVDLSQAIAKVTTGPAAVAGLTAGRLAIGTPADLCVFSPDAYWHVAPERLLSGGHTTPFADFELPARVGMTVIAGRVAYERSTT